MQKKNRLEEAIYINIIWIAPFLIFVVTVQEGHLAGDWAVIVHVESQLQLRLY